MHCIEDAGNTVFKQLEELIVKNESGVTSGENMRLKIVDTATSENKIPMIKAKSLQRENESKVANTNFLFMNQDQG